MARRVQNRSRRVDPIVAIAAIALVFGAAQLAAGALASGITVDEPRHVDRMAAWLDNGWYVPDFLQVDDEPDPAVEGSSPYVYGPAYAALGHGANVLAGNESLGEISRSAAAYDVRHLIVAALALLAVAAVAAAVWRLTGSRRFGLWAAAGLLAVPQWMGQGFFNPKDVPAACGYTLVTVALILALCERPGPANRRYRLAIGAILAGGIFIGVGTRLALWVPFAVALLTYAALRLGQRRLGGIGRDAGTDLAVAAGVCLGFAAVAVVYPNVATKPFTLIAESVSGASDFLYTGTTLTAGQIHSEHPPWWYLPAWTAASLPLLLAGLGVLGSAFGIRALVMARGTGWRGPFWSRPELGLLLVFQQLLMLPLGVIITGEVVYNGMRQHLYVLPAIAILAGVGATRFWSWATTQRPERRWRAIAVGLLGAALFVPIAEQTLLFPYNYTYVNPVAGIGGVNDRWETDYWFASGPDALSRTPRTAPMLCSAFLVLPGDDDGKPELKPCLGEEIGVLGGQVTPFAGRQGDDVDERWRDDSSAVWVIARRRGGNRPPSYCEEVDNVTRWLRGELVVMAYVLRCDSREARLDVVR